MPALSLKVKKPNAEKARKYLSAHQLLDKSYKVFSKDSFIYFPIIDAAQVSPKLLKSLGASVEHARAGRAERRKGKDYREMLKRSLGTAYDDVAKGYDLLGSIAIIEAERRHAKKIAGAIMRTNKSVKTVIRKKSAVKGIYRRREYEHVAGIRTFVAEYSENGARFKFDLRKSFFSTRLAYERKRVADSSRDGERVIVMFAGVGPFAVELAKARPASQVVAIEKNREAYKDMLANIKINKLKNIAAEPGDVKKYAEKYSGFADRIVMPLPKDAHHFLETAFRMAGKKCTIHYYAFGNINSAFEDHKKMIKAIAIRKGRRVRFIKSRVVRPYAPDTIEIVIDFKVY